VPRIGSPSLPSADCSSYSVVIASLVLLENHHAAAAAAAASLPAVPAVCIRLADTHQRSSVASWQGGSLAAAAAAAAAARTVVLVASVEECPGGPPWQGAAFVEMDSVSCLAGFPVQILVDLQGVFGPAAGTWLDHFHLVAHFLDLPAVGQHRTWLVSPSLFAMPGGADLGQHKVHLATPSLSEYPSSLVDQSVCQ